ncbi:MAG: protein kinase [Thermoanaerobaculia bacterium]|nr:protein kinase [Thermoanaerobaculia bacterium]
MDSIGKYEVLEKIGSGGFAIVYKGFDPFLKRAVAIKVCYSRDEETRQRFFREAEIAGNLVHKNITTIFDFGLHDQMPYLIEEYLPGEDLAHMIRRQEPQHLEQKLDFLMQIASGLEYAHQQGVIHRDIKPSNVRVVDGTVLKIMDFGTAKLANVESHLTQTGMTLGTVAYLSPERLLGKPSGTNSDIFSFGVLAFELLSFRRPFSGRNIPHLIDQVLNAAPVALGDVWEDCPPRLDALVQRSLAKDPAERYADCSEVLRDLDEVVIELTGSSAPSRESLSGTQKVGVPPVNLQLTGLLDRARQLHARGKFQRALLILEEVLEMDPGNQDAKQLQITCTEAEQGNETPKMRTEARTGLAWEGPDERRTRKVGEAVASIEDYIENRQVVQAADALRFALQLFGSVEDAPALRRKIVSASRKQLSRVKGEALKAARRLIDQMIMLRREGQLDLELAELLVFHITQLDPDDVVSRDLLELVRQETAKAASEVQLPPGEKDQRRDDAVRSIERFLADGNASMARDALSFAIQMLGEFDEAATLRARIDDALRTQAS